MDDIFKFKPSGTHTSNSSIGTATELSKPASGADKILLQALGQNIRFTLDGTAPTTSSGFQLKAGDPAILIWMSDDITLTVIEEAGTATLEYLWGA